MAQLGTGASYSLHFCMCGRVSIGSHTIDSCSYDFTILYDDGTEDMIGDFVCEQEMIDQSEAIEKEVNEALASSAMNMDDFYKQYEDSIYDRRIHRKMERAKRRDARKAARLGY